MSAERPRPAKKPWAQMSRFERATAVAIWGLVAALFVSIAVTLLLR
jgi:hypothetical protein